MNFLCNMLRLLQYLTIVMLVYSSISCVIGQNQTLNISRLSVEEGLSQSSVMCIMQDSKGYMWFGTRAGGLNKYDGYDFKVFSYTENDTLGISGNEVISLLEDSKGYVWAGTRYTGLNRFDPQTEIFKQYHKKSNDTNSLKNNTVNAIFEDEYKTVWFGTNYGLCSYNYRNDNFHRVSDVFLSVLNIKVIHPSATKDNVWLGCKAGLFLCDLKNQRVLRKYELELDGASGTSDIEISAVFEDNKRRVWIGTKNNGLYRLDDWNNEIISANFQYKSNDNSSLSSNKIRTIHQDKYGEIWIGTKKGLDQLSEEQQSLTQVDFEHNYIAEKNDVRLNQNSIFSFFEDKLGNFWVGTWSAGVSYLYRDARKFKKYSFIDAKSGGLNSNVVSAIAVSKTDVWVGTGGGGLNRLDKKTGKFTYYLADENNPNSLGSNNIKSILFDQIKGLWIGFYDGLQYFDIEKNKFQYFFKGEFVYSIEEGAADEIWVGTSSNLFKLNKKDFSYVTYRNINGDSTSLISNSINKIFKDSKGNIWIGTRKGLNKYQRSTDNFIRYTHRKNDKTSISHSHITSICEDKKGDIWIGTFSGLNKFDTTRKEFKHYGKEYGTSINIINNILIDDNGDLWFTTGKNLTRFTPDGYHFDSIQGGVSSNIRHYDAKDGLQGNQFNSNSSCKSEAGELYFGGYNGFNVFYPDSIADNFRLPDVYITDFKLFNKTVNTTSSNSPLTKSISHTKFIELDYRRSFIGFSFIAINYISPEKNQFAYILEGFDEDWNYIGNKREATYTNLPPGKYTFKVKAANNDGLWNEEPVAVSVTINPPWWQQWWFRVSAILFVVLVLYGYYMYKLNQLDRQKRVLKLMVMDRTRDLEHVNIKLAEKNRKISMQKESIIEQRDKLEVQKNKIVKQAKKLRTQKNSLEKTNITKDKFYSLLAHDLKGPLTTLLGFLELLKINFDAYTLEKQKGSIAYAFSSARLMANLVEDLLQWSRLQRGLMPFSPENINLQLLMDSEMSLLGHMAQEKEVNIKVKLNIEQLEIVVDPNMLGAIIRNIVSNAIKFSRIGGEINIEIENIEDEIQWNITDEGIGIPESVIGKLFDVDLNFTRSGTANEKGTGLGLVLCKEFVELHKGRIWVQSTENKGSTFCFTVRNNS